MLPQTPDNNKTTQNVYGVASNIAATSTQNMCTNKQKVKTPVEQPNKINVSFFVKILY